MFARAIVASLCVLPCAAGRCAGQELPPIRDNSFFVEEGYNQEAGVVQHILTAQTFGGASDVYAFGLTGEYPLGGEDHQLSITLPVIALSDPSSVGLGDLVVSYRHQLIGSAGGIALAPRLSLGLPTRADHLGLGPGDTGIELNLPLSVELLPAAVLHANIGGSLLRVSGAEGGAAGWLTAVSGGVSCIALIHPRLNLMLESVVRLVGVHREDGSVRHLTEYLVSPGIRGAMDIGGVQIVPGLAVPFRFPGTASESGLLAYLSFEHPL